MKCRFVSEYYNFTMKRIKADCSIDSGIRKEIIRRLEKVMNASKAGLITLDETMGLIASHCVRPGEDMSIYGEAV